MRIVQVCPYFFPHIGGVESHVLDLSRELAVRGHDVTVVTSDPGGQPREEEFFGLRVVRVKPLLTWFNSPVTPALRRVLRALDADILHAHSPPPLSAYYAAQACREKGKPLVVTYHCDLELPRVWGTLVTALYRRTLEASTLRTASQVVATSQTYAATSRTVWQRGAKVIPMAVDARRFNPAVDGAGLREALEPGGRPVVLFVGRLVRHKGIEYLLQAARAIPEALFALVGDGPMAEEYRALAMRLGGSNVRFVGRVSEADLPRYYAACDLFVLPSVSRLEAFGTVALEAMACVPQGELVLCNHRAVPVEKVRKVHHVLGSKGKFQGILRKYCRSYAGSVITIKGVGLLPFRLTEDHPVSTAEVARSHEAFIASFGKTLYRRRPTGVRLWKKAGELQLQDYLVFPKYAGRSSHGATITIEPKRNTTNLPLTPFWGDGRAVREYVLNGDASELLGRYLADGHAGAQGVVLDFGTQEREDVERLSAIAERNFGYHPSHKDMGSAIRLRFGGPPLARRFQALFGTSAYEKRIPSFVFRSPHVLRFLKGYIEGDGYIHPRGVRMSTVSRGLAIQLQQLFSRVNIFASVYETQESPDVTIKGKRYRKHARYVIDVSSGQVKGLFAKVLGVAYARNHVSPVIDDGDAFLVPIRDVRASEYHGRVYNVTTMDGTFQISNILVHNCGKPVVLSDIPGVREVITQGKEGLLAEPMNGEDLASKVRHLLGDEKLRWRMGDLARRKVEEVYNMQRVTGLLEDLYVEALGSQRLS